MATSAKPNGNGVVSPDRPGYDDPTPTPLHGRAATYAGGVDPSLLTPSGGKRDADSISVTSTASRKRGLFKKPSFNSGVPPLPSPKRKPSGLASAIASSGLAMANPAMTMPPQAMPDGWRPRSSSREPPSPPVARTARVNRSPALYGAMDSDGQLTTSPRSRSNSLTIPGDGDDFGSSGSGDESEMDDDDAQLLADIGADDIPVTGFAVASNKRNADFHEMFATVPEGEYLIEDYGCALQRDILIQGRLYISEHHICFHANIFGWVTDVIIPIYEIVALEKKMTAFVIPNAIQITTRTAKYTFASFLARDTVYDVIDNIRKLERSDVGSEQDVLISGPVTPGGVAAAGVGGTAPVPAHKVTQCACGREGKHYSETALDTVFPGTPERIYNLLFASGFMKDWMREDLKLEDIQISDWTPSSGEPKSLARNMSYVKPLNGSIGPKQTKCEIRDETIYSDFDDYVVTITTTRTPDVPSGNVFAVKTRTCIMWASTVSTQVVVTTQVEWTGRSFIKGIIERSCIDGQKTQYADLDKAVRAYINAHQTEFLPAGVDPGLVEAQSPGPSTVPEPKPAAGPTTPAALAEARERERNARGMQWAYDTFADAWVVAKRSTTGAIELVREAWEQSTSTTILWFVIVFLVASNVWTLARMGPREEVGRRRELRKLIERDHWVQSVVDALWDELQIAARERPTLNPAPVPRRPDGSVDTQAEVAALVSALDAIEERVTSLRHDLSSLDALD
ncbi:hypothetical protein K488DRAFT_42561 [Vararia minispora EC-137]|uniref:Uncharacterized protein n=1 Tax=Vararia minispora EC-137 TaxID=1314806 RepID=A0ACB8QWF8_9AGAM|nr:hypothetical protein K488DRAFT_42561 [Vararia minispora EC-137]